MILFDDIFNFDETFCWSNLINSHATFVPVRPGMKVEKILTQSLACQFSSTLVRLHLTAGLKTKIHILPLLN